MPTTPLAGLIPRLIPRLISGLIAAWLAVAPAVAPAWPSSGGHEGPAEEEIGTNFLALPTISISLIRKARVRGIFNVNVELELPSLAGRNEARRLKPRLINAYHQALTRFAMTNVKLTRALNLGRLEHLLQDVTDKVLGGGKATLLIADAAVQRL